MRFSWFFCFGRFLLCFRQHRRIQQTFFTAVPTLVPTYCRDERRDSDPVPNDNIGTGVGVKSSVDKLKISQDEILNFKIEISGDLKANPEIHLPDLKKDFDILSTAQSQSLSIKGKELSRQITFIYVLAAKAAGKFSIGEVLVKINKEIFKTQSIDIEITPSLRPKPTPSPENPPEPSEESEEGQVIL